MNIKIEKRLKERVIGPARQRGIAIPLVAVAMLALMAVAGLSLDSSHTLANKTRLQNTVDAAALSAAKDLDNSFGDVVAATAVATSIMGRNADGTGNHEMNQAYDANEINVTVEYSTTLNPFVAGSPNGPYVRVTAQGFDIATTLSRVLGITEIEVRASAVAGPSPTITNACDLAPILVCADDPADDDYGFVYDELRVLKPQPGNHSDVGPGNYKMLRMGCPGGNCLRDNLAGGYDECHDIGETVETEPGVSAGPTRQGFNTRFGDYSGPPGMNPTDYPPDVVVESVMTGAGGSDPLETNCQGNSPPSCADEILWDGDIVTHANDIAGYAYADYEAATLGSSHDYPEPQGAYQRRVMALPVADCTPDYTGQSTIPVLGFACYFMLQPIAGGNDKQIFGQWVEHCDAGGNPGTDPGAGPGPYVIQLYKDPDSGDS